MAGKPRAVLDTNVFVSGLINPSGAPGAVLRALRSRRFTLVSSPPINEEIIEVLNRPYIRDRYGVGERIFDVSFIRIRASHQVRLRLPRQCGFPG